MLKVINLSDCIMENCLSPTQKCSEQVGIKGVLKVRIRVFFPREIQVRLMELLNTMKSQETKNTCNHTKSKQR